MSFPALSMPGAVDLKAVGLIAALGALFGLGVVLFPDMMLYAICILMLAVTALLIMKKSPFYLILFFIALLPLQNFIFMHLASARIFPDAVLKLIFSWKELFLLIMISYILFSGRTRLSSFYPVDWLMLAYFLWTMLYFFLPASFFPLAGQDTAKWLSLRTAAVPMGLYFIGRFLPFNMKGLESAVRLIIICAFCVCAFGLVERLFIPDSFWLNSNISYFMSLKGHQLTEGLPANFYGIYGSSIRRLVSTYVDSLAFGFSNILVIPLALYFLYTRNSRVFKSMGFGFLVILVIGTAQVLNITRAAIAANFIEIALLFYCLKARRGPLVIFFILICTAILFSPLFWRVYGHSMNFADASSVAHMRSLDTGFNSILAHPAGYGLGYGGYVGRAIQTELASESLYFTIAVERGIVGMLLFIGAVTALLVFCATRLKYLSDEPFLKGLAYVIIMATIGYAFASLTTEHWQAFVSSGVYWIMAGLVVQGISCVKVKGGFQQCV
jgi:hypothetical protein